MALSSPAAAEWSGGIEGGAVIRDGGNATRVRLKLDNNARPLTHNIRVDWIRSDNGDSSYEGAYIPRYWFSNAFYAFGELFLRVDKPLGIEQDRQLLAGIGNRFISNDTQLLWAEIGTGFRSIAFDSANDFNETQLIGRGGYRQKLSDLLQIELDGKAILGETVTETIAEASISVFIGSGYLKYGYRSNRIGSDDRPTQTNSDSFFGFTYGF